MKSQLGQPTDPQRALQLSAILAALRNEAVPETNADGSPPPEDPSHRRRERRPRVRSNITIGEILDRTRRAGFGFIAALLALIAVPFVGLSTPFGLAIAFVGGQMIAGLQHPWLPQRIRRHLVTMDTLRWLGERLTRWTSGLERLIRPRFTFMVAGPFWTACGIGMLIQGLALALPLPIPGSNWVFVIPIILYGIGLLESDGLLIMVCHTITLIEIVLGVVLWELVKRGLLDAYHWVAGLSR
ncbi:MAG TPA: exopolysaccharide biosynthesis protein [Phycisphaerae bacterium]|nr:exopolysaccharide biosynthesis protein [Phycisphaerae bacterium]